MSSKTSTIFIPSFADTAGTFSASNPIISSISFLAKSMSALGKSILFITGNISKFWSMAKYTFPNVCASTPCVASTINTAPSHAFNDLLTS